MAVRIDHQKKTVTLSVGDVLDEGVGWPGASSGLPFFARTSLGRDAHATHQQAQADLLKGYRREVHVKYQTQVDDYAVTVQGRLDGVYERDGHTVVEEVKSVVKTMRQFAALSESSFPHYVTQLRLYCFLLSRQSGTKTASVSAPLGFSEGTAAGSQAKGSRRQNVTGHLVLSNVVDGAKKHFEFAPPFDDIESLIVNRVRALLALARVEEERLTERRKSAESIAFPFPAPRPHQDEMIAAVERALQSGRHLMVCAPSGIGKTVAALYPAVKFALAHGKRVFLATAKNTQQDIAWQTLQKMNAAGGGTYTTGKSASHFISALRLRAKEQMCINGVYACHEEFCPRLRQMTEKIAALDVPSRLGEKPLSDPDWLMDLGRRAKLCPFDLALMRSQQAEVIVCDYNYIFDPAVYLRHFFQENDHDDSILILDEAHNLYGRAMDYYSPELRRADIRACLQSLPFDETLGRDLSAWLRSLEKFFSSLSAAGREQFGEEQKFPVQLPRASFFKWRDEAAKLAIRYFLYRFSQQRPSIEDPLEQLFSRFFTFVNVLELAGVDAPQLEDEFSFIFDRTESQRLKILCKDPSRLLRKRLEGFHSVIAMSATLEPMEFYREVLGFNPKRVDFLTLPSPFPRQNRKILVVPALSTTFRARDRSYQKLADIISRVVAQRHGNYAVFFPSYEYLRNTEPFLRPLLHARTYGSEVIVQERAMPQGARDEVLNKLHEESRGKVILAVQGGIFAEGVDFAGDALIGVIVVSPALPTVDFERELLRGYYERRNGQGFEFAYLYPGMTRVIQSVGRLIRTETDRGVAVLICNRFAQRQYSSLFPRDWYVNEPEELIARDVEGELKKFWNSVSPATAA